jgi:hypothetical protein
MPASASRVLIALALAGLVTVATAACGTESEAAPTGSPTTSPTAGGTPEPTTSAAPPEESTPVTIACDELITPQAMYDYNPNYSLNEGYTPAAGTEAADIVALDGVACAWVNQTSGALIEIAVAELSDDALTELENRLVTESNSVPTYTVEGYFQMAGTSGQADAFPGSYWISAVSTDFYEPGDAAPVVAAAITGLGE